jgi:epoxide hydrolase-like predicted phosphatase
VWHHAGMPIRAVIFDIGGVLEYTPPTGWQETWARRLGLEPAEMTRWVGPLWQPGATGGTTLADLERHTAEVLNLSPDDLRALMADLWAEYLGTLNSELATYFSGLRPRYRTGILSNSFVGARENERAAYGFEDMCDVVVYSHEEGIAKPDPRFYRLACERLGASPHEAVFLDDTQVCVDGARAVGMTAIRFTGNAQAIAAIECCLAAG